MKSSVDVMLVKTASVKNAQSCCGALLNSTQRKVSRIRREARKTARKDVLRRLEQLPALQDFAPLSDDELLALVNQEISAARDV